MEAFFTAVYEWFTVGIYEMLTQWTAYLIEAATVASIKYTAVAVSFAWDVAKVILNDIGISSFIAQQFDAIPSDIRSMLAFFKVPDAINVIMSSFATKWVLRFIPGV